MKLTAGRYSIILSIQSFLLMVDFAINIVTLLTRQSKALMLIFFILQDACLVLALTVLLLTFFSTYVFQLTAGRYSIILSIQSFLLMVDFAINIVTLLTRQSKALMLIFFILQDACLVLALTVLLLTFFSTYVFQTGLVYLLYERFRSTLITCMLYFILTSVVHIWNLVARWNTVRHSWNSIFLTFFILQRFTAAVYYYYYKRASLRIADPRFYEDLEWEQNRLNQQPQVQIH